MLETFFSTTPRYFRLKTIFFNLVFFLFLQIPLNDNNHIRQSILSIHQVQPLIELLFIWIFNIQFAKFNPINEIIRTEYHWQMTKRWDFCFFLLLSKMTFKWSVQHLCWRNWTLKRQRSFTFPNLVLGHIKSFHDLFCIKCVNLWLLNWISLFSISFSYFRKWADGENYGLFFKINCYFHIHRKRIMRKSWRHSKMFWIWCRERRCDRPKDPDLRLRHRPILSTPT